MSWCKLLQMSHADANNFDLAFIAFKQSVLTEQNHYTKNNDSWVSICAPDVLILIVRPIYNQIEARLCCPSAPVKQQVWLQAALLKFLGSVQEQQVTAETPPWRRSAQSAKSVRWTSVKVCDGLKVKWCWSKILYHMVLFEVSYLFQLTKWKSTFCMFNVSVHHGFLGIYVQSVCVCVFVSCWVIMPIAVHSCWPVPLSSSVCKHEGFNEQVLTDHHMWVNPSFFVTSMQAEMRLSLPVAN